MSIFGLSLPGTGSARTWLTIFRTRPGERVAKRRRCKTSVGSAHKIKREETVKWFKSRFEVRNLLFAVWDTC